MSNDENNKAMEKMKSLWKVFGKNIVTVGLLISAVLTVKYLLRSMLSVAWSCILITSLCILILLVIILIISESGDGYILVLYLKNHGIDNVLDTIELLIQHNDIRDAQPDFISLWE